MIAHKAFIGTFHSVLKIPVAKDNPNPEQSSLTLSKLKKKKSTTSQLSHPVGIVLMI